MKSCCVCGVNETTNRIILNRKDGKHYCKRHRDQLKRTNKILDSDKSKPDKIKYCDVCGTSSLKTRIYETDRYPPYKFICRKHNLQLNRHGKVFERTIRDSNEYIFNGDYVEIKIFNKKSEYKCSTFIDIDDFDKINDSKIYEKYGYARVNINNSNGKKIFLHRMLLEVDDKNIFVDHINHNTLDNRKNNLRIVSIKQNMYNTKKDINKGVRYDKKVNRYGSSIMFNYKSIWLGKYDLFEEAKIARYFAEIKLFGEYRNKDYDDEIKEMFKKLNNIQIENIIKNLKRKNIDFSIKEIYEEMVIK